MRLGQFLLAVAREQLGERGPAAPKRFVARLSSFDFADWAWAALMYVNLTMRSAHADRFAVLFNVALGEFHLAALVIDVLLELPRFDEPDRTATDDREGNPGQIERRGGVVVEVVDGVRQGLLGRGDIQPVLRDRDLDVRVAPSTLIRQLLH